jgi:hypothetical protein
MNIENIIEKSLQEYDSVKYVIKYLMKNTDLEIIDMKKETERTIYKFLHKETGDVILETETELLAIYYDKFKIWCWAWSIAGLLNSRNFLSKEILIYALKLGMDMSYLKSIFTTSRGIINDATQIDINLALCASIIKQPYIYAHKIDVHTKHDTGSNSDTNYLYHYNILLNKEELDNLGKKLIAEHYVDKDMDMENTDVPILTVIGSS